MSTDAASPADPEKQSSVIGDGTQTQVLFSSVPQWCLILCNPMDCSTPGLPIVHRLLELAQAHVHQIGDAI